MTYSEPCATLTHAENIFEILGYLEPFHNCTPVLFMKILFRSLRYLKPDTCSEPSQRFKIEFFAKIVKDYTYFSKALHLRSFDRVLNTHISQIH